MKLKLVPPTNRRSAAAIAAAKREAQREQLWPGSSATIWSRKTGKGFCTIPRTLGLVMTLLEHLTEKGKDVSRIYMELWCRAFDEYLIEVSDEETFAYASGFVAPGRNVRSWQERIDILVKLGFIEVAPRGSKRHGYILLHDPHKVIKQLRAKGHVPANWWGAYTHRAVQIGLQLP